MLVVSDDVFELVEIHERPFDFIEPHFLHFRTAGDVADHSRRSPATMRTRSIDQTAINEIACAITSHHSAPGVERRENQFAGLTGRNEFAGPGIDDFENAKIGIEMVSAGPLIKPAGAFAPGHLRLGETVGCDDVDLGGAEFAGEVGQLAPDALGNLFTTQNDAPQILATKPFFRSLEQYMINEARHANEHVRFDFPDQPEIPIGPHHLAATCAGDKNAKRGPAEVRLPESEVWRVRKPVQDWHFTLRAANFEEPSAREGQIHQIVLCKQEWNRIRRTTRGAGHENGPKLGLKTLFHFG